FGISGTNAHVIIEHGPEPEHENEQASAPAEPLVWVLSAKTDSALRAKAQRLRAFAVAAAGADLVAAAHNLANRARFGHRAVVVAADRDELIAALGALANGTPHPAVVHGVAATEDVKPVFVFPGQGSQWAGMAVELLETNEAFRDQLTRCDEALAPHTGWSVIGVLRGDPDAPELESSAVIQPALFAVMVSLAAVWRSIGVHPAAVIGHSQGEITAACAAGALSVQDAAKVVALRSKSLMKLTGTGGMLAVSMPAEPVRERLAPWEGRLWTAIMSGPESTVVAGDLDALEEFAATLDDTVRARRVAIDYAAHTPHIEVLHDEIVETLGEILPQPTDVAFCSALYADFIDAAELTAEYWFNGLRNPVRFEEAIRAFTGSAGFAGSAGAGTPLFVESSPHPVLTGHIQDTLSTMHTAGPGGPAMDTGGAGAVGSLRRGEGGWRRFLLAAAQAYTQGAAVDWTAALGTAPARHVAVPTYPFEHRRYWIEGGGAATDVTATGLEASRHPLLGAVVPLAEGDGFVLAGRLSRSATPWLADHVVEGEVLLPGTAFVELGLEAAAIAGCDEVEDLTLQAPLILPATGAVQFQVKVGGSAQAGDGRRELSVYSRLAGDPDAAWTRNATGMLAPAGAAAAERLAEWPPAGAVAVDLDDAYGRLSDRGYDYGPTFQGLLAAWRAGSDAYVEVALPEAVRGDAGRFTLHPALLDAALHLLVLDAVDAGDEAGLLLPFSWTGVRVDALGADALRVRISAGDDDQVSLAIHDAAGNRIAGVQALTLRRVPRAAGAARAQAQADPVAYAVDWVDLAAPATAGGGQRWAIVGYGEFADELGAALERAGVDAARYYDLSSLADMSAGEVPATVLVPYRPEPDPDAPYAVREGLYQVLDLVQGWVGDERYAESRLVFVTSGAFGPGEPGEAGLTGGPVWGLIRSAQSEHPGRFALVDVADNTAGGEAEGADWAKVAAVLAGEPGETQLVVRGGTVSVPRLAKRSADDETGTAPGLPDLGSGTVLVTGGTGRLGGLVAERLIERCGARELLLVSRRGSQAPGAAELVARLAGLGATATIADCDVSDPFALRRLLDSIPPQRPLCAVVHTAGVVDDATVERLSGQQLDAVFAPKADAAWHLHELTRDRELAAFVMFSSVAGLLGNPGQGNYAAANVFLDILAAHRRSLGLPAVSIAWGLWGTEDSAGDGMAGHLSAADVARLERSGIAAMPAGYGLQLLDAALTAADPLVVAAKWDQGGLRSRAESDTLPPVLRSLVRMPRRAASAASGPGAATGGAGSGSAAGGLVDRLATLTEADGRQLLAHLVRSHVAAVLAHDSVDGVDVDKVFNELGFDSLTAVELRNRLNAETGLRLPATVVFSHPTVTALADYLYSSLAPETPSPEETLRKALEQVEHMLAGADGDNDVRGKLVAILQTGLAKFGGENRSGGAAEQIDSASDEEIFALIDKEL
ncbi:MAG TPA: type I polyketide synthase, partial [Pseudonocardiaceae bacterium]|nr:type I polyketide synthase [Pseudonocardiaceae bacterium]